MRKLKLVITLKSDLCVASGYSYAGQIDSDICFDQWGLPYIPARRLKGCFRETKTTLLYDFVEESVFDALFGKSADEKGGSLCISNARIVNYENIVSELASLRAQLGEVYSPQRVLEQYTHIVAQTAINEDGVADDSTLRYTRAVNHYCPGEDNRELVFEAQVSCESEEEEQLLRMLAKGTRNIGLKRNRGFGSVMCDIVFEEEKELALAQVDGSDELCVITYALHNEEPLMLSKMSETHSEKYISGGSVLGALASRFLQAKGLADSQEFQDLFLNGTTCFGNAYPSLEDKVYYPAPMYVNRLKITKTLVNTYEKVEAEPGDQPKKLKGKFVYMDEAGGVDAMEVSMKLHYHHRKKHGDEDEMLYSSEAIEIGHTFVGQIYTLKKYEGLLKALLGMGDLFFGKSKGVQYGRCRVTLMESQMQQTTKQYKQSEPIVVTLLSDGIFMGDVDYSVDATVVADLIKRQLGDVNYVEQSAMLEAGLVSGYHAKWNLHKPLYPVLKAGSAFVFEAAHELEIPEYIWLGEKNQEGYGFARVQKLEATKHLIAIEKNAEQKEAVSCDCFKKIAFQILKKQFLEAILEEYEYINLHIDATQIGRVTRMVRESVSKNNAIVDQFKDFVSRVNSIKTDSVRKEIKREMIDIFMRESELDVSVLTTNLKEKKNSAGMAKKLFCSITELGYKAEDVNDLWYPYVLEQLTLNKYRTKEKDYGKNS